MTDAESILTYYNSSKEHDRLTQGLGVLEFERTKRILASRLPSPPSIIHDIGGGPGRYASWLTGMGYEVHHSDLVPLHVEQAVSQFELTSTHVCDARALPYEDHSSDCVLLFGPLYHLCSSEDRQQALSEAKRILKPGGLLFAASISKYASTIVGLHRGWIWNDEHWEKCRQELAHGRHEPRASLANSFSIAYFHHPTDFAEELEQAGYSVENVWGLEGTAWLTPDFDEDILIADRRERLIEVAEKMETDPMLSPHMLALAKS